MIASLCQCFFLGVSDVEKAVSSHFVIASCTAKKLVVLTTEWLPQLQSSYGYESFTLVLETNWIRQPEKQVPNV